MDASSHPRGQRVPLQPRSKTEQAGPISEGMEGDQGPVKPKDRKLSQSRERSSSHQQPASAQAQDKEEKRSARLALSRTFLAAPVGRSSEELCPEEVRLANTLDSWGAPDDDGSLAPSTRRLVRSHGVPPQPIGPRPSWLDAPSDGHATETRRSMRQPPADADKQAASLTASLTAPRSARLDSADLGPRRNSEAAPGRLPRSRSLRATSMALEFPIDEDTEILNFDGKTMPVYGDHAKTAPLPGMHAGGSGEADVANGHDLAGLTSPQANRFSRLNDTLQLHREGKGMIKRGAVSPADGEDAAHAGDVSRRVRFQPRGNQAGVLGADVGAGWDSSDAFAQMPGAVEVFDVHERMPQVGAGGGFAVREDTDVIDARLGGNSFAVREDTDVVNGRRRGSSFAVREDTDVMNGHWGGSSFAVREDTDVVDGRRGGNSFAVREDTDVVDGRWGGNSFAVREDTDVVDGRQGGNSFAVREDTDVVDGRWGGNSFAVREDTDVVDGRWGGSSFAVREDTDVMNGRRGGNSFAVREDTDLIDARRGGNSFAVREDTDVVNGRRRGSSFAVREDTEVINAHRGDSAFNIREDTEVLNRQALTSGSAFEVREDTEVLARCAVGAQAGSAAAAAALGRGLSAEFELPDRTDMANATTHGGSSFDIPPSTGAMRARGRAGLPDLKAQPPAAFMVREDTAPVSREGSAALGCSRRLHSGTARRRLPFGNTDLPAGNEAAAPAAAACGATQAPALSPLEAAEPACLVHDEFAVLEETRPAHAAAADGGGPSEGAFDSEEDAENACVRRAAARRPPQARSNGAVLCTREDKPDELLQCGGELGSECSSDWDASAPASPMRRPGSNGLGALTPAGSPLRNQSPHRGLPPRSPNKLAPVHRQRGRQVLAAPVAQASSQRPRALQSASKTLNPFEDSFTTSNLQRLGDLSAVAGVTAVSQEELQAFVDAITAGDAASLPGLSAAPGAALLGRGGYAAVYRTTLRAASAAGASGEQVALKLAEPPAPWEFAALRALVSRVPQRYSPLFMPARCIFLPRAAAGGDAPAHNSHAALARADGGAAAGFSVLAMPLGVHGTLLDLINAHKTMRREIGSCLVLYLALQLVLALHAMQQARIIHTDIKPDNCLLSWPPQLAQGGTAGVPRWTAAAADRPGSAWGGGCMQVIDFGRAIDLDLLPAGSQFVGASTTEGMQCPEMLGSKPWHYCHDAFCVAATMHALLLGRYIGVQAVQPLAGGAAAKPIFKPCTAVPKSNPRKALWDRVLRALLNCPLPPERPNITPLISQLSAELEASEAASPQLWKDMMSAQTLVTAYSAGRQPS
eukprot:jgi/Ulvmu1/2916/UM147_0014.1